MGFTIDLPQKLMQDQAFIEDLARFAENLVSEAAIRKRWRLEEEQWVTLGENDELVRAIEEEKIRRVRNGSAKREAAQGYITKGPAILDGLMMDAKQSGKTRIDAVRALDQLAAPEGSRFAEQRDEVRVIINLTADTKLKDGSINPADILEFTAPVRSTNPNNTDVIDAAPVRSLPNNAVDDPPPVRRGPGRPKGSRNKPKTKETETLLPFDTGERNDDAV
jgi:hypothetical protein